MNKCSIGLTLNDKCHKTSKIKQSGFINLSILSCDDREIIKMRAGIEAEEITSICLHHHKVFMETFATKSDKCCNLFKKHPGRKKKTKGQLEISLQNAKELRTMDYLAIPGEKFCRNCYSHCKTLLEQKQLQQLPEEHCVHDDMESASTSSSTSISTIDFSDASDAEGYRKRKAQESTDSALKSVGESPLSFHSINKRQKVVYAQKKLTKAVKIFGKNYGRLNRH